MRVMDPEKIADFLRPIGDSLGVEVVEAEFRQGQNPSLTVYIDRAGGIDLDACEAFHNAIDAPLDELDPTYGAPYTLNVSSLGLDRPFRKAADFEKNIGEEVEVKLYASVRGKKILGGHSPFLRRRGDPPARRKGNLHAGIKADRQDQQGDSF